MNRVGFNTEIFTDAMVIEKVTGGDIAMFEMLIRRYNAVLYKIGRMYGFNHQDTEDLMQDTHVAAYTQLKSFEERSSYKTWISKIMVNKCLYKMKYGYFKKEVPTEDVYNDESSTAVYDEKTVLNRELSGVLEKSLEKIPVLYRSVFALREIEGFSVAETAELLGITTVNVKVRLNRARALLQKQVEQFYSQSEIYSFNLIYCDDIVKKTLHAICRVSD
jgi:RNA polymerase sigma-70 factor (ECF subfamily)